MNTMLQKKISEFDSNAVRELNGATHNEDVEGVAYWKGYRDALFIVSRWMSPGSKE